MSMPGLYPCPFCGATAARIEHACRLPMIVMASCTACGRAWAWTEAERAKPAGEPAVEQEGTWRDRPAML